MDEQLIKTQPFDQEEPAALENATPEEKVKEALRAVNDPEINLSVVALGLIREIILEGEEGEVKMMMTTPFCPYAGWLVQQVKEASTRAAGKPIKVTVLPDLWDPNYMEDPGLLNGW
ncbi:MAG: DUF59 domain-containing protein [Chloroflexi bacterium]|nr:DUF59 domain-containing protein [Chloroflexota bacterium]MBI3740451.1 DUF59 domain-containing protein [Chloroflexota bacterium]